MTQIDPPAAITGPGSVAGVDRRREGLAVGEVDAGKHAVATDGDPGDAVGDGHVAGIAGKLDRTEDASARLLVEAVERGAVAGCGNDHAILRGDADGEPADRNRG